jgi:tetratricopeptide (TPR) repeat protein
MSKSTKRSIRTNFALAAVLIGVLSTLLVGSVAACPPEQVKQADHAYMVAAGFIQARNWQEAIPSLQSALAICPDHVNSLRWLGKAYMATKQYDKAVEQFDALVEAQGNAVTANDFMDQGKAHARLKQYKQARISYIKAERLDGDNCNILYNLGVMNYATRNYEDAVETLEKAHDGCPDIQEQVLKQLAKASEKAADRAEKKGDVAGAEEYRAKLSHYASSAGGTVGYKLITDRMKAKDYQGAISAAQDFLAKNPESDKKASVYLNMARSQGAVGQKSASFASYKSYLGLKPADGKIAGEYIEKLAEAERCEEALGQAQAAWGRTDAAGRVYVSYGWGKALECAGSYVEAKEKFQYVVANGSGEIKSWAGQEVTRQEQLEERRQMRRQNAGR